MNLKIKKRIAREFIGFCFCILITVIILLVSILINIIQKKRVESLTNEIGAVINSKVSLSSLITTKEENQREFTQKLNSTGIGNYSSNYSLWTVLYDLAKKDSIKLKWDNWDPEIQTLLNNEGFDSPEKFKRFIISNIINADDIKTSKIIESKERELATLYKDRDGINYIDLKKTSKYGAIAIFILVFVIRYLVYAMIWSISTLKTNSE